ncbi:iron-sulfur cluster-binding protein [Paenibacillus pini JCM 16418]|uniref:Methylated-DNA--protein-cysteine methyltransferase n=1 Tax=Paenibacillus pini JCM 16418 TaxID=1236976 RepID=W7YFD2_9BACL|nr:iron-sulfur cluster-binding protein [Paenibacillus pini JCM 16418]
MPGYLPKNHGKNWTHHEYLLPQPEKDKPLLLPILDLSNREFKEKFGESAAAWRGRKPIQRNAVIALGNFKDISAVPRLGRLLQEDPRPELRGAAAWSLGRIGGKEAMDILNREIAKEQDEKVQEMLKQAREKLDPETGSPKSVKEIIEAERVQAQVPFSQSSEEDKVIYYDEMESPIGPLTIAATGKGICLIEFGPFVVKEAVLQKWSRTWCGGAEFEHNEERLAEVKQQLKAYFDGERKIFDLPLDLRGTAFQLQVWNALADIPYGELRSYSDIASAIGRAKAVRAVGGANNKNPVPLIVPCHRVIGTDGSLVGYGGGMEIKRQLLLAEDSLPDRTAYRG